MSSVRNGILLMLCINVMFVFAQLAAIDLNGSDAPTIIDIGSSPIGQYDAGGYVLDEDIGEYIPASSASVSPTTGNIFTDTPTSLTSWLLATPGVGFLTTFLLALPMFLNSLNAPAGFVFAISALWYGYGLFLLVSFIMGRNE